MNGFPVLLAKEVLEAWRTRRLPVVVVLFGVLGILSALTARYLPEILELALGDQAARIPIPAPAAADVVVQLQKNLGQLGALTAIVLAMGSVAGERERGTAAFVLAKPASRGAFLTAKLAALGSVLAVAVAVATLLGWIYAAVLFEPPPAAGWVGLAALAWLGLLAWSAVTFLASTVLRSSAAAAGVGVSVLVVLSVLSAIPAVGRWLPAGLDGAALALATGGSVNAADLGAAVVGTAALVVGCAVGAWLSFRHREL